MGQAQQWRRLGDSEEGVRLHEGGKAARSRAGETWIEDLRLPLPAFGKLACLACFWDASMHANRRLRPCEAPWSSEEGPRGEHCLRDGVICAFSLSLWQVASPKCS